MTEEIIERLEEYLGSEEFEYEAENCMEELDESGEGINAVLPLLRSVSYTHLTLPTN